MRILLVTDWPALVGGTERIVERLRDGLEAGGDEVRLLTSSAGSAADGTADFVAYGSNRQAEQAFLQVFNPSAYAAMRRAIAEFRPDAVHLNMFLPHLSPSILSALRGVPAAMVVHDYKPICPVSTKLLPDGAPCREPAGAACSRNGCIGRLRAARERPRMGGFRRGLGGVGRIATVSVWMQDVLAANGIEAELVSPPAAAPGARFERSPAETPRFLYAGRLAPVKGVELLLAAFARVLRRVPEARLRIVGDGPSRDAVVRRVRELGLEAGVSISVGMQMSWLDELEGAWAVVVPSIFREPLGLVPIEAILHGVPVIAPAEGGLPETVVPGRTGLLVRARDEGEVAAAMEAVCAGEEFPSREVDPVARAELRDRHDPDRFVARTRELLVGAGAAA